MNATWLSSEGTVLVRAKERSGSLAQAVYERMQSIGVVRDRGLPAAPATRHFRCPALLRGCSLKTFLGFLDIRASRSPRRIMRSGLGAGSVAWSGSLPSRS